MTPDAAPARAKFLRADDEVLGLSIAAPSAVSTSQSTRTWPVSPDGVVERPARTEVENSIVVSGQQRSLAIAMRAAASVQSKPVALAPVVARASAAPAPVPAAPAPVPAPAPAAPAPAPVIVAPVAPTPAPVSSGPVTIQSRGEQALVSIGTNLASIGFTISFHPYTGGLRGLTYPSRNHIEIFVRPSTTDSELRYMIAHEVGHAIDLQLNSGTDHNRWRQARGMAADVGWWPNGIVNDFATPAGDFAECFASWKVGSPSHSAWGGCGSMFGLMAELATG